MKTNKYSHHVFYGGVSVLVYVLVIMFAAVLGDVLGWTVDAMNLASQILNIGVLYIYFYRPYHRDCNDFLPSLLPEGRSKENMGKMPIVTYGLIILLGASCCIALNNWFYILRLQETITTYEEFAETIYAGDIIFVTIKTVFLASVLEEMLIRGLCYHGISQIIGRLGGMFFSALIFGAIHGNLLQGMYAFLLGILFAYVYDMYGRKMIAPILAHMSANTVSVIGTMIPSVSVWMMKHFYELTGISTILLLVSIVGIYCYRRKIDKV